PPPRVRSTASPPPVAAATNRPKMVAAARPASCWKVMLRQSDPKCDKPRRASSSQGPAAVTRRASTGSRAASSSVAAATAAVRSAADGPADRERRRGIAAPYRFRPPMEPDAVRDRAEAALAGDLPD